MEDTKTQPCRPLVEVLQEIEDPRHAKGLRYSLVSLLNLCCAGMLCGCRTYSAIAQWGRECSAELAEELGFSVVTTAGVERRPGPSTLFYVLRAINRDDFERRLGMWMQDVLSFMPGPEEGYEAVAIDGKTLRGSAKAIASVRSHSGSAHTGNAEAMGEVALPDREGDEVPGMHLISAFSHRLGITLGQCAVPDKGNEITGAPVILRGLMLEGWVITLDALYTQRSIATEIVSKGGTT